MRLRELELKDAPLMLEWMHDADVIEYLRGQFSNKTIEDCETFIKKAKNKGKDIHLAIVSDEDEYMGTVSLKNIDRNNLSAEFSIVVKQKAMGRGYAWTGMKDMLVKAFEQYGLECIYWCISKENLRAIRFCDKHNFHEIIDVLPMIKKRYERSSDLKWYSVLKGDAFDDRTEVAGCKIVHIKTIPTVDAGELSYFEASKEVPFEIKRIYYISKVPEGTRRGFHAHRQLKQLLFCPYGKIQLILENECGREEIELSDPSIGVVIVQPTWREMLWLQKDSVLCVAASDYYTENDYIRSYDEFKGYMIKERHKNE